MGVPVIAGPVIGAIGFSLINYEEKLQAKWHEQKQVIAALESYDAKPARERLALAREHEKNKAESKERDKKIEEKKLSPAERIARQTKQRLANHMENELERAEEQAAFTQASYWMATKYRIKSGLRDLLRATPILCPLVLLPIFMFGFWLLKTGALQKPSENPTLFRGMAWIGLSLGLAMTTAALLLQMHPAFRYISLASAIGQVLFMLSQSLMAAGYFGFFVAAIQRDFWKRSLRFLAPLGRMALTNYLMHSVLLTTIFYGYAGNMFGRIGRAWQVPIAAAILGAQLVICRLWLKHFRYGPMEWLWRSFTYWQRQPIRVQPIGNTTPGI
jgi:uncharacterized protein